MSLARAALLRPKQTTISFLSRRSASSHAHGEHANEHYHEDSTVYPQESFFNKVWAAWTVVGLGAVAFYKFAPAPGEGTYLTRFISHYSTPKELWGKLNRQHLLLSVENQADNLTLAEAKRPPVHRYRYPQVFEQHSTHLQPVGTSVDLSELVIKGDKA